MPLTRRDNGRTSANRIDKTWFNDFMDLLTGLMTDQDVTLKTTLNLAPRSDAPDISGMTAALQTGASPYLPVGTYKYSITFVDADGGETDLAAPSLAQTVSTASTYQIGLFGIPLGPAGTVARKIYRTKANINTLYYLATISDNTTTSYAPDAAADSTLTVLGPVHQTFGGTLVFQSPDNTHNASMNADNGGGLRMKISSFLGIMSGSTQVCEVNSAGHVIASGGFYTTGGSFTTGSGQSFDSFDYAESYQADQSYSSGSVLCPGSAGKLTSCTHDSCPAALIVSSKPGSCLGIPDSVSGVVPMALVGRVTVNASSSISAGALVCSDGNGGLRALAPDEMGYALGIAFHDSTEGQVGILIRPMYCKGR